mmetsp:Transcript_22863/g.77331  ORF Transcript_22863/g.77331 Transcript_22863/m.77331 type:complete len:202 (+) Transcript_22863:237-842(+)
MRRCAASSAPRRRDTTSPPRLSEALRQWRQCLDSHWRESRLHRLAGRPVRSRARPARLYPDARVTLGTMFSKGVAWRSRITKPCGGTASPRRRAIQSQSTTSARSCHENGRRTTVRRCTALSARCGRGHPRLRLQSRSSRPYLRQTRRDENDASRTLLDGAKGREPWVEVNRLNSSELRCGPWRSGRHGSARGGLRGSRRG